MFLPSVITSGLLASTTFVLPFAVTTPPPSKALVDTILKRDTSNTWTNANTCGWYSDIPSSAFHCGNPDDRAVGCHTNSDNVVGCTMDNDPTDSFYTTCVTNPSCTNGECSNTDKKTLGCAISPMTKCASLFWSGSPTRSMFSCDSVDASHSMLDEPAYIVAKSTELPSSSSSSTSSDPPPPPPRTTSTTPPSSSPTSTSMTSSKKHTPSTTTQASSSPPPPSSDTPPPSTPTDKPSPSESSAPASTSSPSSGDVPTTKTDGSPPPSQTRSTSSFSSGTVPVGPPVVTTSTSTILAAPSSHPAVGVPSTAPSDDTSGLSTGAKAGVGAGAGAGLLVLLAAIAFILLKKRRAADREPVQHNVWPMYDGPRGPPPPPRPERSPLPLQGSLPGLWSRVGNREGGGGGGNGAADYDPSVGGSEVPVAREATFSPAPRDRDGAHGAHELGGAATDGSVAGSSQGLPLRPPIPPRSDQRASSSRTRGRLTDSLASAHGAHELGATDGSVAELDGAAGGASQGLPSRPAVPPRSDSRASWRSHRYPDSPGPEGLQHSSTRPARGNHLVGPPPVSPAWQGQLSYSAATGPSPTQQAFEPEDGNSAGGHAYGRYTGNRARGTV